MKAVTRTGNGGPEVLQVSEIPVPQPGSGQVVIAVYAFALNSADALQRMGTYDPPAGASKILGLEVSGVVESVGEGVQKWKAGDRVMALLDGGGYAEKAVALEGLVMPLPDHLSFEQGAAIPETWLTAYLELVVLAGIKRGDFILIHAGASGVGSAAIQIARSIGARVMVTASSADKLQYCKELGAEVLVNYKEEDFLPVAKREGGQPRLTGVPGGGADGLDVSGVDVILDLVGASNFEANISALTVEGRLLLVGLPSGSKAQINLAQVLTKRLKIIGSSLRARPKKQKAEIVQSFADFSEEKFASGEFKPAIDTTFPLADIVKAHEHMGAAKNKGKIIVVV